jgi:hypothetical protein
MSLAHNLGAMALKDSLLKKMELSIYSHGATMKFMEFTEQITP